MRALRRVRGKRAFFLLAVLTLAGISLIGASAAAADTTFSQTTPFTYDGFNSCTGEYFSGTGNMHFTVDSSVALDGSIHYHLSTMIDGLQAAALLTGKKYVVQDQFYDYFNFVGADEETFDITAHYIRQGEDGTFILGDDFYERFHTHITTNDAGMVTAFQVQTTDQPCQ